MDKVEFEFPDEKEAKAAKETEANTPELDFEIEDDTPAEDRNREPLPKHIVEELDQDELEEYSEKVKIRLKQMKKVYHDERREKDSALRERQAAEELTKRLLEENKKLKSQLSEGEKMYLDTFKNAAELELNDAERAYKSAYEDGDSDKLLEAQRKLSEVNYKLQKIKDYVPSLQYSEDDVQTTPEVPVARPDPRATAWQERNTWFGQDEEMTSLALGLHQKLVKQHGEAYTTTNEYWQTIDDTMRRRFPDYFQSDSSPQPEKAAPRTEKSSTVVAPATRSTSSKKIVLKKSQLDTIKRLGITPEQYARELMKMEATNG